MFNNKEVTLARMLTDLRTTFPYDGFKIEVMTGRCGHCGLDDSLQKMNASHVKHDPAFTTLLKSATHDRTASRQPMPRPTLSTGKEKRAVKGRTERLTR